MEARTAPRAVSSTYQSSTQRRPSLSSPSGGEEFCLENVLETGLSLKACRKADNGAQ